MKLVTGGAGFIGSHIAQELLARGEAVRVVDNLATGMKANLEVLRRQGGKLEVLEGDLCDPEVAARACEGAEVVFHLAAIPSVPRSVDFPIASHHANVTATLLLARAASRAGVRRVVYSASSSAYGDPPGGDASLAKHEDLRPRPISPYAVAKLAGELYMQSAHQVYGLETVCLRYFNVFGPRQNPFSQYGAAIPRFAAAMLAGESPTVYGDGLQSRDFTYVSNVVEGNLLAAAAPASAVAGQVMNLACGGSITLLDLIAVLNEVLATKIAPRFEPPRAGDVRYSKADITLARRLLGYEPQVGLREGIERLIDFLRAGEEWNRFARLGS